ncbi:MAG TPA: poly(R)-hydroxyalkanoic acid synthase subunit PhaE [Actinomycetota bacterium]
MLGAEQAKAMVDVWREGTQKAWETWFDAFAPSTGMTGITALRPPPATDTWSEALAQALRAWVDQAVPVAQSFVGGLLPDPAPLSALFDASVAAWEAAGRHVAVPGVLPGDGAFGALVERLGKSLSPLDAVRRPELGAVVADLGKLWTLYLETLKKLSRPWFEALGGSNPLQPVEVVAHDPGHHSGLARFSELSWDVFERSFGRLLQSPSIGFTRELNEKLLGAFSAWLEFRRANVEYQMAVSAALSRSTTKFLHELASLARKGEPIGSLRDLLGLWGDTLDGVLIESFRSEEYAKVQGNVVRAAMAYRMREREAMDVLGRISHVPTRREIDEIARQMHELRKEVRHLQRAGLQPGRPQPADEGNGSERGGEQPGPVAGTAGAKPAGARPGTSGAKAKPAGTKPKPDEPKPKATEPGPEAATPRPKATEPGPEAATPKPEPDLSDRPPAGRGKDQS